MAIEVCETLNVYGMNYTQTTKLLVRYIPWEETKVKFTTEKVNFLF